MKGLFEILTEKKWMVSPDFVHGIRKSLEHNLNTHAVFSKPEKNCGYVTVVAADGSIYYPEEYQISEDGKQVKPNWALDFEKEQTFQFVSVITIDGPRTITNRLFSMHILLASPSSLLSMACVLLLECTLLRSVMNATTCTPRTKSVV